MHTKVRCKTNSIYVIVAGGDILMNTNIRHVSVGLVQSAVPADSQRVGTPRYARSVRTDWLSAADEYIEDYLDLHKLVVRNQATTFFIQAVGESMSGAGIHDGDLLVADRSITPMSDSVVIAAVEGELTAKMYTVRGNRSFLQPENPRYKSIEITGRENVYIWGVVTYVLRKF